MRPVRVALRVQRQVVDNSARPAGTRSHALHSIRPMRVRQTVTLSIKALQPLEAPIVVTGTSLHFHVNLQEGSST